MWCKSLEVLNPYEALKEANMTDLKPCPFCGGKAKLKRFRSKYALFNVAYYVECSVCKVRTTMSFESEEPIEAWNRRAGEEDKHETD